MPLCSFNDAKLRSSPPLSQGRILSCLLVFVGWLLLGALPAAAAEPSRPNVIVLLVDDLGYECLGANGGRSYQTPVVDRLAAQGMRFEQAFVQPNCTPTRVALMTGQINQRNYVHFGVLEESQRTFGNLFRDAGYDTAIVGKWQLGGSLEQDTPRHFGFDEHCLYHLRGVPKQRKRERQAAYASRYINPGLAINGQGKLFSGNEYAPDLCNDFAIDYIARHRDRPFLLYYPMMLTHGPFDPTPDSSDYPGKNGPQRTRQQHYQDMVAYNDKLIGKLVDKLVELELEEKTLLLFLGDNGTPGNFVSRMAGTDGDATVVASKGRSTRAGMHVPLVAYWPGTVAAGQVCNDLIDTTDILPTLCAAAGITMPQQMTIDGRSFLPQLQGEHGQPREWIYSWFNPLMAKWNETVEMAFNKDFKLYASGELYDWRVDPDERHALDPQSLAPDAAKAARQLRAALDQYRDVRPPEIEAIARALRDNPVDADDEAGARRTRRQPRRADAK